MNVLEEIEKNDILSSDRNVHLAEIHVNKYRDVLIMPDIPLPFRNWFIVLNYSIYINIIACTLSLTCKHQHMCTPVYVKHSIIMPYFA